MNPKKKTARGCLVRRAVQGKILTLLLCQERHNNIIL